MNIDVDPEQVKEDETGQPKGVDVWQSQVYKADCCGFEHPGVFGTDPTATVCQGCGEVNAEFEDAGSQGWFWAFQGSTPNELEQRGPFDTYEEALEDAKGDN